MTDHPPILIDGRRSVRIRNLRITGGEHNIHLHRVRSVLIEDCVLVQPVGAIGKHILCDQCQSVVIRRVRCEATKPTGDGINLHNCRRGLIEDCSVNGPKIRTG